MQQRELRAVPLQVDGRSQKENPKQRKSRWGCAVVGTRSRCVTGLENELSSSRSVQMLHCT